MLVSLLRTLKSYGSTQLDPQPKPNLNNVTSTSNSSTATTQTNSSLKMDTICSTFLSNYQQMFKAKEDANKNIAATIINNSSASFTRCSETVEKGKRVFRINFVIKASDEDFRKNKKFLNNEREIAFFNFVLYEKDDQTVSYFSEVSIKEQFQSFGLFSTIFNVYDKTLKDLKVDMDYLHVKSQNTFTAQIYAKRGYKFTPASKSLIDKNYGGEEAYLRDSSVSYKNCEHMEMYRALTQRAPAIESSVEI